MFGLVYGLFQRGPAALAAVEPARAGMAAGLVNTLRQVGTAGGVAVIGALYASHVTNCRWPGDLPAVGQEVEPR